MKYWNEVHTAYVVARVGTISKTAAELGIHRATVIRNIEVLEKHLGTKLFQRHARGYTPTETGLDLLSVAKITEEQLKAFEGRTRGRKLDVTGEIIITSVEIVAPIIVAALKTLRQAHPNTTFRYVSSRQILNLAYGEAHIAIRAGSKPAYPDNVVLPFFDLSSTIYAHTAYIEHYGMPKSEQEFSEHHFVCHSHPQDSSMFQWLEAAIPDQNIIFRSESHRVLLEAVSMGLGLGFMPTFLAQKNELLHPVIPAKPKWNIPFWIVTHVDIHRTAKVQTVITMLREAVEATIS